MCVCESLSLCMFACRSVSFVKHFWHSLVTAFINLICFSCHTQPPTVAATVAATAVSVRDVGSKLCVGVFAFEGVCGKQCAKKKSFAFAFLRHGCSICSLTFCLCMYTHAHTWISLYMRVYITETRYVFSLSSLRIALRAYLRRSHLAAAAASLPLSLSLPLSSACSLT